MRRRLCITLIVCLASLAQAQDASRQARIDAATTNAVSDLLAQIRSEPLRGHLTVKDFLDETNGEPAVVDVLQHSMPIGGPRWLDDSTCQVRLEANGGAVANALIKIAYARQAESPISGWEMARLLAGWNGRAFTGTGSSAVVGVNPLPPAGSAWTPVPPDARQKAIDQATNNAVDAVLGSISSVDMGNNHKLGETWQVKPVNDAVTQWLMSRPVTSIDYRRSPMDGSLQVQVTLSASAADLFDVFRAVLTARSDVSLPADDAAWSQVRAQMIQAMVAPVGTAELAQPLTEPAPPQTAVVIPSQPPDWTGGAVDVAGIAGPLHGALRAARAAEADALVRIRSQVMALKLEPDESIGDACRRDAQLAQRVDRAIEQGARLYKADYPANGTVVCHMSLDLGLVWSAVAAQP